MRAQTRAMGLALLAAGLFMLGVCMPVLHPERHRPGPSEILYYRSNGPVWFTQTTKGNIAHHGRRRDPRGEGVKRSEPFGITIDAAGDPWYAMMSANKVAELQLR